MVLESPKPPEIPEDLAEEPVKRKSAGEEEDDDGPLAGEVIGAPA